MNIQGHPRSRSVMNMSLNILCCFPSEDATTVLMCPDFATTLDRADCLARTPISPGCLRRGENGLRDFLKKCRVWETELSGVK